MEGPLVTEVLLAGNMVSSAPNPRCGGERHFGVNKARLLSGKLRPAGKLPIQSHSAALGLALSL